MSAADIIQQLESLLLENQRVVFPCLQSQESGTNDALFRKVD